MVFNQIYRLIGDLQMGYSKQLFILVQFENNENEFVKAEILGMLPFSNLSFEASKPIIVMRELQKNFKLTEAEVPSSKQVPCIVVFNGIYNKSPFKSAIKESVKNVILEAMQIMKLSVEKELEYAKRCAEGQLIPRLHDECQETFIINKIPYNY
ncbi:MAG: hypothetical protein ACUZ8E_14090 [Candidatus Anammoxibacter sp.]